jgi:hypothetical protein
MACSRWLVGGICLALAAAFEGSFAGAAEANESAPYSTPAPGSPTRGAIMDALRPLAEWAFAAPVRFVVTELRVAGPVAFAAVRVQRPDGTGIDLAESPLVTRDGEPLELVDGPRLEALLQRSGATWVPVHHAAGSSDVWYAWEGFCPRWGAVLPEYCGSQ